MFITRAKNVAIYPAVKLCAAYTTHDCKTQDDVTLVYAGDTAHIAGRIYQAGTVVSYAIEYGDDPIAAHNDAILKKHSTHWFTQLGTCITSSPQSHDHHIHLDFGDIVSLEGRLFKIDLAANKNVKLVSAD